MSQACLWQAQVQPAPCHPPAERDDPQQLSRNSPLSYEISMRKQPIIIAAALIIIGGIGLAAKHVYDPLEPAAASVPAPAVPVVAGTVAQHDVPIYLTGVGTVIAYNTVLVTSQVQGQIVSINFVEGQKRAQRRFAGTDRSASLSGANRPDDRHPRSRPGATCQRASKSRPLHAIARERLCHAAIGRNPERASGAAPGVNQGGRGSDQGRSGAI